MLRHFLGQNDLTVTDMEALFARAESLKKSPRSDVMSGRSLVMFFEKTSTRTRLSFEIGMTQLGGHAVYVDRASSQLSRGESIADTARVVSRYADLMMARVDRHSTVEELAANASIPVINGLSDREHPCQSLTDLLTIGERTGRVAGTKIAYVGDGNNNVTHSLMLGATRLGADMRVAAPSSLFPESEFTCLSDENARMSGGKLTITEDAVEAVTGADVVYTDTWVSMGVESEQERRRQLLAAYQVNEELTRHASPEFIFMHCLPAHVGEEVTPEVAYGTHSVMFDQAENRLHAQKALMEYLVQSAEGDA